MTDLMPWFRMYSGDTLGDRKITRICKNTGQPRALILGVWTTLLCLANESPIRGCLLLADNTPYTVEDIQDETGLPEEALLPILGEFRTLKMITLPDDAGTIQITNWHKRQYKSDSSTDRVRKYREAHPKESTGETFQRNVPETFHVTEGETVDSTSTSTSTSDSKEGGYGGEIDAIMDVTAHTCEQLYQQVTGQISIPSDKYARAQEDLSNILAHYGGDPGRAAPNGKRVFQRWCATKGTNNRFYSRTNVAWLGWWLEEIAPNPGPGRSGKPISEMSRDEFLASLQAEAKDT